MSGHSLVLPSQHVAGDGRADATHALDDSARRVRPLVVRCGGMGEIVLLTPLLDQLQARFGTPVDVVASGPWTRPLLDGLGSVGDLQVLGSRNTPYWINQPQRHLVAWLKRRGAGPIWFCDSHSGSRALLRRACIPDTHVSDAATLPVHAGEHLVDRWIRFAMTTPPAFEGLLPASTARVASAARLKVSAASEHEFAQWRQQMQLPERPYIVIQAGNKRNMRGWWRDRSTNTKHWPEARWAQLIRALRDLHPDDSIVLLGVQREYRLNADIMRIAGVSGVYNAAGTLPVTILLPLLQKARGMVSVDTGPAHAAAALRCPTVSLFGAADPLVYRPGGVTTPAMALSGRVDGQPSIRGISVESVVAAWGSLTGGAPRPA